MTTTTKPATKLTNATLIESARRYYKFVTTKNPSLRWDDQGVIVQWLQIRSELVARVEAHDKGICFSFEGKDMNGEKFLTFVNTRKNSADRNEWLKAFKATC